MNRIDPALVKDVRLLCLDAGNTVIFLDHDRLSRIAKEAGFDVPASRLVVTEGEAKRLTRSPADMVDVAWTAKGEPGAAGWGRMMATMFARAGVPDAALPALVDRLWASHLRLNLYSRVPDGFVDAMDRLRAAGVKTAIVSNSEGMLDHLFTTLDILQCFDVLADSGKLGVEKPDPRIFAWACEQAGASAAQAIHLGDTVATDIDGARAAGLRCALVDPYGHYEGLFPDVPRVPGVVEVADAIIETA